MKRLLAVATVAALALPAAPANATQCAVTNCILPAVCRLLGGCQPPPPPPPPVGPMCFDTGDVRFCI